MALDSQGRVRFATSHAPELVHRTMPFHVQGLIPTTINRQSGTGGASFSVGAAADSYYEYLLKLWLLGGQKVSQHHSPGRVQPGE